MSVIFPPLLTIVWPYTIYHFIAPAHDQTSLSNMSCASEWMLLSPACFYLHVITETFFHLASYHVPGGFWIVLCLLVLRLLEAEGTVDWGWVIAQRSWRGIRCGDRACFVTQSEFSPHTSSRGQSWTGPRAPGSSVLFVPLLLSWISRLHAWTQWIQE